MKSNNQSINQSINQSSFQAEAHRTNNKENANTGNRTDKHIVDIMNVSLIKVTVIILELYYKL